MRVITFLASRDKSVWLFWAISVMVGSNIKLYLICGESLTELIYGNASILTGIIAALVITPLFRHWTKKNMLLWIIAAANYILVLVSGSFLVIPLALCAGIAFRLELEHDDTLRSKVENFLLYR